MTDDIIEKLNREFLKGVLNEAETLYVFAQIRKLFERDKSNNSKYPTLSFYCDWTLHIQMDRSPTRQILVDLSSHWKTEEGVKLIGFERLREELNLFTSQWGIVDIITNDPENWFEFRRNLIQILIDIPLVRNDTPIRKFSLLKKPSGLGLPTSDYYFWYQAVFDNGETEEWNIMLADYGEKREEEINKSNREFLQKYVDKARYKNIQNWERQGFTIHWRDDIAGDTIPYFEGWVVCYCLKGSIAFTLDDGVKEVREGDIIDMGTNSGYSGVVGVDGCDYVLAQKRK